MAICPICNKSIAPLCAIKTKDGKICPLCANDSGLRKLDTENGIPYKATNYTIDEYRLGAKIKLSHVREASHDPNLCPICNKTLGFLNSVKVKDGKICMDCTLQNNRFFKTVDSLNDTPLYGSTRKTIAEYRERVEYLLVEEKILAAFNKTAGVENKLEIDSENELFKLNDIEIAFPYSALINFEVVENGKSISSGGLGTAVVGGLVSGGFGAVVGSNIGKKKTKSFVSSLSIRISLDNKYLYTTYIQFINPTISHNSSKYQKELLNAEKCISLLELIVNKQSLSNTQNATTQESTSAADEILKYKNLLDIGAITEDEFNSKKSELLDL